MYEQHSYCDTLMYRWFSTSKSPDAQKCLDKDLIPEGWRIKTEPQATEWPNDLVAQLVRAWQAICQVMGSSLSPKSLSPLSLFLTFFL